MARNLRARTARTFAGVLPVTHDSSDSALVLRLLGRISGMLHARGYALNLYPSQPMVFEGKHFAHDSQLCGVILINEPRESPPFIEAFDPAILTISCLVRRQPETMRVFMPATIDDDLRSIALSLVDVLHKELGGIGQ